MDTDFLPMIIVFSGPLALALVHFLAGYIRVPARARSVWMSFACGAAIAYVFIHILPVITVLAVTAGDGADRWAQGEWVFATALAGTCAYYAVEKLMQAKSDTQALGTTQDRALFFVHIAAFALYNFLIGYMVVDYPPRNVIDAFGFYGALALHFILVDHGLRERHERLYDMAGRWIMACAVIAGAIGGVFDILAQPVMIAGFAFLAGGMILNVLKDELPEAAQGRLVPFTLGAGLFGVLFVIA